MSFFVCLVVGIAVGIGLMFVFVHFQKTRSKRRSELATIVAAFAKMRVEELRKILPAAMYPSWIMFSERQRLNWLNLQLTKIWPYLNEATSELIKSSVEPILEQYRPVVLSSLKFSKFTLGNVAPQFTGVSIIEDGGEGIALELEVQWDGNPTIILDINTRLGVALPVKVKDIAFTGLFRLIFKPLVEVFPCIGAVTYSLKEKEKLDFSLKVVGGDISTIPGIYDVIEGTIRESIEDYLTQQVVPILQRDYSELELKPVGTLEVKLVQAKELTNKDIVGKSDPYAVLYVRPLRNRMKTSKTINNQLYPVWNEHFEFTVEDVSTQRLVVKVFDDEAFQASELIGCALVWLKGLEPGKVKDVWLKLVKDLKVQRDNKYRGQVHLELLYCPFGMENPFAPNFSTTTDGTEDNGQSKTTEKRRKVIVRGVLSVTVISAEDLPATDIMGKADPYVLLHTKKIQMKYKTKVVKNCLNPVWNQTFDFVIEDGLHDLLILEVYDHDMFGKDYMGRCILTLTRVILEGEYKDSFQLDEAKSGKLNLHLKWTPQPIHRDS